MMGLPYREGLEITKEAIEAEGERKLWEFYLSRTAFAEKPPTWDEYKKEIDRKTTARQQAVSMTQSDVIRMETEVAELLRRPAERRGSHADF